MWPNPQETVRNCFSLFFEENAQIFGHQESSYGQFCLLILIIDQPSPYKSVNKETRKHFLRKENFPIRNIKKLSRVKEYDLYCGKRLSESFQKFENSHKCLSLISFCEDTLTHLIKAIKAILWKIFIFNPLELLRYIPVIFVFFLANELLFNIFYCVNMFL